MADLKTPAWERNSVDLARGFFLLVLGVASMAGVVLLCHWILFPWLLAWTKSPQHLQALDGLLLLIFACDFLLHPTWVWTYGRRFLVRRWGRGLEPSSGQLDDLWAAMAPKRPLGFLKMLPLIAALSDPHNTGLKKLFFLSDLVTIPLFGSRLARAGMEHLRTAGARTRPANIAAAEALLTWMKAQGRVPERRLAFQISVESSWMAGFALSRNLDVITRAKDQNEQVYRLS